MNGGPRRGEVRRINRAGLGRSVSQYQLQRLDIAPVWRPPFDAIYQQQMQRREFWENLGGEIGRVIESINEAMKDPAPPVPYQLGPGVSYEQTRQRYAELMAVINEVAKDSDSLTRTVAVVDINQKLEFNEDYMIRVMHSRAEAQQLQAIIVRSEFMAAVLGWTRGSLISTEELDERRDAYLATGVRVPEPVLLGPEEVALMFDGLRCMNPGAADAASGR